MDETITDFKSIIDDNMKKSYDIALENGLEKVSKALNMSTEDKEGAVKDRKAAIEKLKHIANEIWLSKIINKL